MHCTNFIVTHSGTQHDANDSARYSPPASKDGKNGSRHDGKQQSKQPEFWPAPLPWLGEGCGHRWLHDYCHVLQVGMKFMLGLMWLLRILTSL